jgi:hypothetical protein
MIHSKSKNELRNEMDCKKMRHSHTQTKISNKLNEDGEEEELQTL